MSSTPHDVLRVPQIRCLQCNHTLNAIGTLDGSQPDPEPGSPVLCLKCGAVMTIEGGALRGFTPEEMAELVADTETMDYIATLVRRVQIIRHGAN